LVLKNTLLLEVRNLHVEYVLDDKVTVNAVNNVDLNVPQGEILGIVGESGCGKSTLAYSILASVPPPGRIRKGEIIYYGWDSPKNILLLSADELKRYLWKEVSLIPQAAQSAFNPVMRIKEHFIDTAASHGEKNELEVLRKAKMLLNEVMLDESVLQKYPHELSGGMKQRVAIALSLLLDPKLVILDEPTSALDLITQKFILNMLKRLKEEHNLTMIFITHDLSILAEIATYIAVMYAGKVVEISPVNKLFYQPKHPYTLGLLKAVPSIIGDVSEVRSIRGFPPDLRFLPSRCLFAERCDYAEDICFKEEPKLTSVGERHYVACHKY